MSRVYKLTKLGKGEVMRGGQPPEERRVMEFIYNNNNRASEEQLDIVIDGARYIVRKLKKQGLAQELTQGDEE